MKWGLLLRGVIVDKFQQFSIWFKDFFNVAIGSVLVLLVRNIIKKLRERKALNKLVVQETNERFKVLENAMISLQHDRLYQLTEMYIMRGYVTLDELDNLEYIFKSYRELGGNGSGERRYQLVQKLPIINEKEVESDD